MSASSPLDLSARLAAARSGDLAGMGPILDAMRPYLIVVARSAVSNKMSPHLHPSDVVQETYVAALLGIGRFYGETEEELLSWMVAIVHHQARNAVKHLLTEKRDVRKEVALESGDAACGVSDGRPTPLEGLVHSEEIKLMRQALRRLPNDTRRLIVFWSLKKRVGRVAEKLDISVDAAYTRLSRAMDSLYEQGEAIRRSEADGEA